MKLYLGRIWNRPSKNLDTYLGCGCLVFIVIFIILVFLIPMLVACGLLKYLVT